MRLEQHHIGDGHIHRVEAQGGIRNLAITVTVDTHKPNGSTWDVFGGAPDIALCTDSAFGLRCMGNELVGVASFSRGHCQDAFTCTFVMQVPTRGPTTLTLYDVDISNNDLIGTCMVSEGVTTGRCGSAQITAR